MSRTKEAIVTLRILAILAGALLAVSTQMGGCVKDGDQGVQGAAGVPGTPAAPPPTDTQLAEAEPLPGCNLVITSVTGGSGTGGNFMPGDRLSVTFTIKKNNGAVYPLSEMDTTGIWFSGPSFNYQHILPTGNTKTYTDLKTSAVQNSDSSYTYVFGPAIPATFGGPLNDSAAYTDGELSGQTLLSQQGTYTVAMRVSKNFTVGGTGAAARDVGNATKDILLGDSPGALTARQVVKKENCNTCHTRVEGHGGGYRDTALCVTCHTAGAEDPAHTATVEFKVMIHKIHDGAHLPSVLGVTTTAGALDYTATPVPYTVAGNDFSEVNFPIFPSMTTAMPKGKGYSALSGTGVNGATFQTNDAAIRTGVVACGKCHGDPDGSGSLTAPAQGAVAYAQQTRRACGSCHDNIVWGAAYKKNDPTGMIAADTVNDSMCVTCHVPNSGSVLDPVKAHLHPMNDPVLDPGVVADITALTGGTLAGGKFQAGDSPSVTFTVKNEAGANIPLATLDSSVSTLVGPTNHRQLIFPQTATNGATQSPYDYSGRLQAQTTGNATMGKVFQTGTSAAEVLSVDFSSSTVFTVTGSVSGALGGSALPASPSTNVNGSSLGSIELAPTANAQTITVNFSNPTTYTVTGSVTGAMGGGTIVLDPSNKNGTTRFVHAEISFTLTVGTTANAASTIYLTVYKTPGPTSYLFAVVAGRTSVIANDRFYYEIVPAASSYILKLPMDIVTEFIGDATAGVDIFSAGNVPVYLGRQQLYEAATTATTTTTSAALAQYGRFVDITPVVGFANNDVVAIEPAAPVNTREYVAVSPMKADGTGAAAADTTTRLYFKTPLRYAHAGGVTVTKVTLTLDEEGAANKYSFVPATGVFTEVAAGSFTTGRGIVLSYRTDGRFGSKRHAGDTLQAKYVPVMNDSTDLGQDWGDWTGLPYKDGTYTAAIYFTKTIPLISGTNEYQTYTSASKGVLEDFLFGATASTIEPESIVSSGNNCNACHDDVMFHGGGRRGGDTCFLCHGIPGAEDLPRWNSATTGTPAVPTALTTGTTIAFRTMLHKIHRGSELANAATYTVVGNGGTSHTYGEVEFPAWPNGVRQCDKCHGNSSAWKEPAFNENSSQTVPTKRWMVVCGACHDADFNTAHFQLMTTAGGLEACGTCHGIGKTYSVELMHTKQNR